MCGPYLAFARTAMCGYDVTIACTATCGTDFFDLAITYSFGRAARTSARFPAAARLPGARSPSRLHASGAPRCCPTTC